MGVSTTGAMANTLGQDNPFRYRGYSGEQTFAEFKQGFVSMPSSWNMPLTYLYDITK